MTEYLEIPVAGRQDSVKLVVYPQSSKAKVYEEREPLSGESKSFGTGTLIYSNDAQSEIM